MALTAQGQLRLSALMDARVLQTALGQAEKDIQKFASTATIAGFRLNVAWTATFGAVAAAALKFGSDWELAFAGVRKTVDETTKTSFPQLEKEILGLARTIPKSAAELANLARIGGQLGVGADDLAEFTETIAKLGIAAAELPAEQAAVGLARFMAITTDSGEGVERLASVLAFLGDKLPTTEERILNFAVRLASAGTAAGLTREEILGLSGGFSSVIEGTERASTSVEKFFGELVKAVGNGGERLEAFTELARVGLGNAGLSSEQFAEMFKRNAGEATTALFAGFQKLSKEGGAALFNMFEKLGITSARQVQSFLTVANASEVFNKSMVAATQSADRLTKLQKEYQVQVGTVAAQLQLLKNILQEAAIKLFKAFEAEIRGVIATAQLFAKDLVKLAEAIGNLPGPVKTAILAFVGLVPVIGTLLIVFGQLASSIVMMGALASTASTAMSTLSTALLGGSGSAAIFGGSLQELGFMGTAAVGTTSTGILGVATAIGLFGGAVIVGIGLGSKMSEMFLDMEDPTDRAIAQLGLFERALEAGKAAVDLFGMHVAEEKKRFDTWVDAIKKANTQAGLFLAAIGVVDQETVFDSVEASIDRILEKLPKLPAGAGFVPPAADPAAGDAKRIIEEQLELAALGAKIPDAVNKTALSFEALAEAKRLIAKGDELKQLEDAARSLGISVEDLKEKGLLPAAEALMRQKEAAEESKKAIEAAAKAHKALVDSFQAMTKVSAEAEFAKLIASFNESGVAIKDLQEKELDGLITKLEELANAAGIDATSALKEFKSVADQIDIDKPIKMASEQFNLRGFVPTVKPPAIKPLKDVFAGELKAAEAVEQAYKNATKALEDGFREADEIIRETGDSIEAIDTILGIAGISADNLFAKMIKGAISVTGSLKALGAGISGIFKAGDEAAKKGKKGGFLGGLTGGEGLGSFTGIISAIGNIGQLAGPIGAAVSSVVGIISSLFKKEWEKVADEVARDFGVEISEALAKEIEKVAKNLDLGRFEATLLKLGDIISEAGGLTESNAEKFLKGFNDLLNAVGNGTIPLAEGMKGIGEAFTQIADGLQDMGVSGKVQLGELINRMRELGLVTDEVKQFIKDTAKSAIDNFTVFLDFLDKKFTEDFMESAGAVEAVNTNVAVLTGTFAAAVNAAGGLAGAIALLPESFGSLLEKMREVVGSENEALNKLTEFYNFVKNNEEQLLAIEGLVAGMGDLAAIGLLTKDNITSFGMAAVAQMQDLLANTENQTLALVAMGPQIGELLQMFNALGVEVPPELQAIADAAIEAGASLEPPEGIEDILADIRDILLEVAGAFGVAADAARGFNAAAAGAGGGGRPRGPGDGGDNSPGFATGGFIPKTPGGMLIRAGEGREGEFIVPESKMAAAAAGAGTLGGPTINVNLNGTLIGNSAEFEEAVATAVGRAFKKSNNTSDIRSNFLENL